MKLITALSALSVASLSLFSLAGCASDAESTAPSADDDLTKTATGVSLDASDDGAVFALQEGKKVVVNLSFGGFTANPYRAWTVASTDRSFGYPKITTKAPRVADAPTTQKLEWKAGPLVHAGETHKVTLSGKSANGGPDRTFTFIVRIVNQQIGAKRGATCGGIAGIMCADGLDCKLQSSNPDATGICRIRLVGRGVGEMCAGLAGITCAEGLECKITEHYPDADGTCVDGTL